MKEQAIEQAQAHRRMWESVTSRPFTTRENKFATMVRNAALTEAIDKARIFGLGLPIAQTERLIKAIESLKEPTP
jgi:hypothetical protein